MIQQVGAETFFERGRKLAQSGLFSEAIVAFNRTIDHQPDWYVVWYERGKALMKTRQVNEAIVSFKEVIAIREDYSRQENSLQIGRAHV